MTSYTERLIQMSEFNWTGGEAITVSFFVTFFVAFLKAHEEKLKAIRFSIHKWFWGVLFVIIGLDWGFVTIARWLLHWKGLPVQG